MTARTYRETSRETAQKTSRNLAAATPRDDNTPRGDNLPRRDGKPRIDKEGDMQEAIIEESGETGDWDRDLVHGDGGTIDLPTKPGDLSKDD